MQNPKFNVGNKSTVIYWGCLITWMGLIFYLSSQPSLPGLPDSFFDLLSKKLLHFSAYAILLGLWWLALGSIWPQSGWLLRLALLLTALYAISDEWHQTFVPNRNGQLSDVLIDTAGALAVFFFLNKRLEEK